jgi:ABC-type Na+ efflux pump permease subunit
VPAAIAISQVSVRLMQPPPGVAVVVVDQTGRYQGPIQQRFAFDRDQEVLAALADYAGKWKLQSKARGAVWSEGPRPFTPADVAAFEAGGGLGAAEAEVARVKPAAAPDFHPPNPTAIPIAPPDGLVSDKGPDAFGASLTQRMKTNVATAFGPRKIGLGVYVPADYGAPGVAARLFTDGTPRPLIVESVRQELSSIARADALKASGLDLATLARIQGLRAPITISSPPEGGRERMMLHSALPLALAYLLLLAIMMSGSWMLQGLIEERSNKLLEAVLACVTPDDLLFGKLIGVMGVGFVMIGAWIAFALGAAFLVHGAVADFLRPALSSVSSPGVVAALAYYFLAGYLAISMLFLAVGAVSDSMRDAQAYLTPMILVITIPFVLIAQSVLLNPDSPLPRILSWIPIYAPFAMMARLGSGVPTWEVAGSAALLAAFIGVELMLISRLFRSSLLQTGQTGGLRGLLRRAPA